ncbi:PAS/PAC sensor-containing diguanylate cyclase [Candidatus Terasakiella magnetica]|uniref:PAS/PAC sensor-containing diguanylate cyclase n=1 Tax=Candidatus Terasakiella magnetica TaxID=1867952 RepID=A0A1C3RDL6_9PROT|nr:bifunctional diguanylate cyclase/phosphodiesterase [Candidatus Terasakiella magnetica]SCA55338.1 PAS/PAC sensor-containing diguanylate cyclase [Candidatus Terasakiella magnetica]
MTNLPEIEILDQKNKGAGILSQVVESTPVPTFVIDKDHRVIHWNAACEKVTGVSAEEMLGTQKAWHPFYPEERPTMADLVLEDQEKGIEEHYKGKYHKSEIIDGAWEAEDFFPHFPDGGKWLSFTAALLKDDNGEIIGAVETLRDITREKRSEASLKKNQKILSEVVDGCPVPMFVLNDEHVVTHWNKACESIIGTKAEDIVGTKDQWKAFYDKERPVLADLAMEHKYSELSEYYKGIWAASPLIADGWEATDYFPNFKPGPKWLYFTAAPLHSDDGSVIGAVETLQDVSNQKQYEAKLEFQANHDALTGLANRNLLTDRLKQAIAHAGRDNRLLSLLFIDLDNFKTINDTLGHNVGDQLICETGRKISNTVRSGDTVARLGGDEFVVLLFAPESEDHVTDIVQRLTEEVATSYCHEGQDLHVGCSVGVAMYPQDGTDVDTLMKNADSAMYLAKATEKGSFCFFTQDLTERAMRRLQIENDLHKAIDRQEFELVYQPIFELATGKIIAAEALLRWHHPEQGVINPVDFIHIAEETSMIVDIGEWVLREAAKEAMHWHEEIGKTLRISINVSARQFRNHEIHEALARVYSEIGQPGFNIELELTENLVMRNPEKAEDSLDLLRDMGVHLAMDDFGTGYSSLAYLRRFPFDMIKIDKAFVDDLGRNKEAEAIVRAMLELGRALGLRMLAEGVETELQRAFLAREGCDEVQGFLFSRPCSVEKFRQMLIEDKG